MRGEDSGQSQLFSYISIEERIPETHPLREIREMTDFVLERMSRKFGRLYSRYGRPSIPPEQLLRALVLQILFSIRSERMLMEQLSYNLLFRWFVGLNPDDPVWNHSVFSKNRDRLLRGEITNRFFREIVALARNHELLSDEHFSVDGTLIESLASLKSFQPRRERKAKKPRGPRNPDVDFRGQKRKNDTHGSTTDPEALLYRKGNGKEARLYYTGHALMDHRHGLLVDCCLTQSKGTAERDAAAKMVRRIRARTKKRITLAADKAYDTRAFVSEMRALRVTPHIAQRVNGKIDRRTTRHPGYAQSQRIRKRIEESFGWLKTVGLCSRSRFIGLLKTEMFVMLSASVYNMVRIVNLQQCEAT